MEEAAAIDQVVQKNISQLQQPGVLFVVTVADRQAGI